MINIDKKKCNGCGVCALKCPKNAITMLEDEEGFLYPVVDENKCINCGACTKICSNIPEENKFASKVYATKNKSDMQREKSTSGGMFKLLAEYAICKKQGIVFGVELDNKLKVIHSYTDNIDEVGKYSISKYVRSDLKNSYRQVEQFVKDNRFVLFTGTPCQCYALRKYLGKDYDNLLICEIICHSNPSPLIYEMFKTNIEKIKNKKIVNIKFRNKTGDLKPFVQLDDGSIYTTQVYNDAFNNMLISRPSCSECQFCSPNRKADITIGDFWGIDKFIKDFNDDKGISLMCLNSNKAINIFNQIKHNMEYKKCNLKDAFKYNHNSREKVHKNRKKLFEQISKGNVNENNIIFYLQKYTKKSLSKKILLKIKRIINSI